MSSLRERAIEILPGQYFDAETGLHQNWHRDYDPSIGRYLEADPRGLSDGPSLYAYAANNPITYVDPTGLAKLSCYADVIRDKEGSFAQCDYEDLKERFSAFEIAQDCERECKAQCVREFLGSELLLQGAEKAAHAGLKRAAAKAAQKALKAAPYVGGAILLYEGNHLYHCTAECRSNECKSK